jgi:eukaryotic-like serine/threonine-protein kinase
MAASPTLVGQRLGHYLIVQQIGAGGMGVVYLADDERLDRRVAIKVLTQGTLANEVVRKRFRKEALSLSKVSHPNIAVVYDFDNQDNIDFLVMEYVPGLTLAERLARGRVSGEEALDIAIQIAAGVGEAHEAGIIHRDLKPQNVIITTKSRAKILDFGLAKLCRTNESETTESSAVQERASGTLPYMAPEVLCGKPSDTRSDIWSFGVLFYQLVTGTVPFQGKTGFDLTSRILHEPPSEMPDHVPAGVKSVALRCLEKQPERRYQHVREIIAALEALRSGQPPYHRQRLNGKWSLRKALLSALFGLLILLLVMWNISTEDGQKGWMHPGSIWPSRPTLAERSTILVGDFENHTGDPVFDETLGTLLTTGLEQSRYLSVFPSAQRHDVLERMRRPSNSRINEEVGREICLRENLRGVVLGGIVKVGAEYVITIRALNPEGKALFSAQGTAAEQRQILTVLDDLQSRLRRELGESLDAIKSTAKPLERVTSGSLDAIRSFSIGKRELHAGNLGEAEGLMRRAVQIDPNFAMAYAYLGSIQLMEHRYDEGRDSFRHAVALADRLSERERHKILGDYSLTVTRNLKEAIEQYRALLALYPDDYGTHTNLALAYQYQRQWDVAIEEAETAKNIWDGPVARVNLAYICFLAGQIERAIQIENEILISYPAASQYSLYQVGIFHLVKGDGAQAEEDFLRSAALGGLGAAKAYLGLADLHQSLGRYRIAAEDLRTAMLIYAQARDVAGEARGRLQLARLFLEQNDLATTRQNAREAAKSLQDPKSLAMAGSLLMQAGDFKAGQAIKRKLEATQASPWNLQVAAELLIATKNVKDANDLIQRGFEYPVRTPLLETQARVYVAGRRLPEAAAAYEQVLLRQPERATDEQDEPAFHCIVLDYYRLGVIYQESGDAPRARVNLSRFVSYIHLADVDAPYLEDARRRLQQIAD